MFEFTSKFKMSPEISLLSPRFRITESEEDLMVKERFERSGLSWNLAEVTVTRLRDSI